MSALAAPPELAVRALRREDRPAIAGSFARLSRQSRQLRFGLPVVHIEPLLGWLDDLDGHRRAGFGACVAADPVGVARYAMDGGAAEVAVTVLDDWQGRGIGTVLLRRLTAHARAVGIDRLRAFVLPENVRARRLLGSAGWRVEGRVDGWLQFGLGLDAA